MGEASGVLREFVGRLIEAEGGAAEPVEPDGLEYLAPPEVSARLAWPEAGRLGFGPELPDGARRVGLESDVLERFGSLLGGRGRHARRAVFVSPPPASSPERVVEHGLTLQNAVYRVVGTRPVWTRYLIPLFRYTAMSDEKRDGLLWLAVNLSNGSVVDRAAESLVAAALDLAPAHADSKPPADMLPQLWESARVEALLQRGLAERIDRHLSRFVSSVVVCHPANYGPYRMELLAQAAKMAEIDDVRFLPEPVAAAIHYTDQATLDPGEIVVVYDFGGGTFDVAVLRRTGDVFDVLGTPAGLEHLGGLDLDEAVFGHVIRSLEGQFETLDPDDPATQAAVSRLRDECKAAKEALSSDTDTSIPVLLPGVQNEVRLTRTEFETMILPSVVDTVATTTRAIREAGLEPGDVGRVLLVGGSARVPLVAQLLNEELGRPIAIDTHPKYAIALGAARWGVTEAATAAAAGVDRDVAASELSPLAPEPDPEGTESGAADVVTTTAATAATAVDATTPPAVDERDADLVATDTEITATPGTGVVRPETAAVTSSTGPSPVGATTDTADTAAGGYADPPTAETVGSTTDNTDTADTAAATPTGGGHVEEPEIPRFEPPATPSGGRAKRWRVVAAVAGLVIIGAGAAAALSQRDSNAGPVTRTVEVRGTVAFTDTGIDVREGDRVSVTATGESFHSEAGKTDPDGLSDPNLDPFSVIPGTPHNALIGKVGDGGAPFRVGGERTFRATASGRLLLGVNDKGVDNTAGGYRATITVES